MPTEQQLYAAIPDNNDFYAHLGPLNFDVCYSRGLHAAESLQRKRAYDNGYVGAFCDAPRPTGIRNPKSVPDWARSIERFEADRFAAEHPDGTPNILDQLGDMQNGEGKCNLPFRLAKRFDPRTLTGNQDTGNCTACSLNWNLLNTLLALEIAVNEKSFSFGDSFGTAITYGDRGHSGQGMSISRAAWSAVNHGSNRRMIYLGGRYDFRDENTDERYGMNWGGSGPPADILAETKKHVVTKVGQCPTLDAKTQRDLLFNNVLLHHGGVLTGTRSGTPLHGLTGVGAHAQSTLGYDDREETKGRLNLPDDIYVVFFWQSWGSYYSVSNWPEDLFGPYYPGCWAMRSDHALRIHNQGSTYGYYSLDSFGPRDLDWDVIVP